MKRRTFFNWLIIFLGVVAIVGYCFTPAFAEDEVFDPWNGVQVEDNSVVLKTAPDPNDLLDDSFGQNYQYTWVPSSAFVPDGSGPHSFIGPYRYRGSGSAYGMNAPVNLPSGAYLSAAQLFYYDSSGYYVSVSLMRYLYYTGSESLGNCGSSSSGTPGYSVCTFYPNHTIRNRNAVYQLSVHINAPDNSVRFMGVRLCWKRQISPAPASATFSDVQPIGAWDWAYPSVEALAASGITQGCPDCAGCFCPGKYVTRAAMATFLARALGLHWDSDDGY